MDAEAEPPWMGSRRLINWKLLVLSKAFGAMLI